MNAPPDDPARQPLRCVHYVDAVREEAGGVVRAALELVAGLAKAGAEVKLLTVDAKDVPPAWRSGGPGLPRVVEFSGALTPWFSFRPGAHREAASVLEAADVLHLHTVWDPRNLPMAAAARRLATPYFVTAHGMLADWSMAQRTAKKRVYLRLFGATLLGRAHALLVNSDAEREQAARWAPWGRGRVLPLPIDLPQETTDVGPEAALQAYPVLATAPHKVLFLSRVFPGKGVERLTRAVATLRRRGLDIEAVIVGPAEQAYEAELRGHARECGVADHVHFLGPVFGDLKFSVYRACQLFALPSDHENFGLAVIEAMLAGMPVVTTKGVKIWREIQECGAAVVGAEASENEEELADAIAASLAEPASVDEPSRGRQKLREWLDPTRVIGDYLALYREAAAR